MVHEWVHSVNDCPRLEADIAEDGSVVFQGQRYASLSMASGWAKKTVVGAPPGRARPHLSDGWTFWQYRNPETGALVKLDKLRRRYLSAPPSP